MPNRLALKRTGTAAGVAEKDRARAMSEGKFRNSKFLVLLLKYFDSTHIWVYHRTNGRLRAKLLWFPAALLTTTGRKTGEERITPTLYLRDGDKVVLPASFGGRHRNPATYLQLQNKT